MATIQARTVDTAFSALTTTAITCVAFLVLGFGGEEILKRLTRSGFKSVPGVGEGGGAKKEGDRERDRGVEQWAMVRSFSLAPPFTHQANPPHNSSGIPLPSENLYSVRTDVGL